jgi:hypothetical protein
MGGTIEYRRTDNLVLYVYYMYNPSKEGTGTLLAYTDVGIGTLTK